MWTLLPYYQKKTLDRADIPAQSEPTSLDFNDGKRPDVATIVPWSVGKYLVRDFTCSDTYAPSYIKQTSKRAGAANKLAI